MSASAVGVDVATASLAPCARCGAALEMGDLRCAICALAVPLAAREAAVAGRPRATVVRCDRCGAAVTYSAEAHGSRCGFCGAVTKLEEPLDPMETAEAALPFAVSAADAQRALFGWMRTLGFFRPGDLATRSSVAGLRPLWWAAWVFDAHALVSWSADSDYGAQRASWAPHTGQTAMSFENVLVSASRGLTWKECAALTPYFDVSRTEPVPAIVEHFDVQRAAARGIVADAVHATAVARLEAGVVPGRRFRNVHATVLLQRLHTRRFAMPTYVLAYEYRGKSYRALVHGQDARVVLGDAPYSIARIVMVIAGGMLLVVGLVALLIAVMR